MVDDVTCPGCGLDLPADPRPAGHRYFNASPECWSVFTEVLATEFQDATVFGAAHQLSVDAYAAQHAGGGHPDKSVTIHLVGLRLVLVDGLRPSEVPALRQKLAASIDRWPPLEPPRDGGVLTVLDVALAEPPDGHVRVVRRWAEQVWTSWRHEHATIARLAAGLLPADRGHAEP